MALNLLGLVFACYVMYEKPNCLIWKVGVCGCYVMFDVDGYNGEHGA
jgi:hypothetical protein